MFSVILTQTTITTMIKIYPLEIRPRITQTYIKYLTLTLIMAVMNIAITLILAMILIPIWVMLYTIVILYPFNYDF